MERNSLYPIGLTGTKKIFKLKILILARRYRINQSEADEHDYDYNKKTLEKVNQEFKDNQIRYDLLENYKKNLSWQPNVILFLGFDPKIIKIKEEFKKSKFCIWAKCYSSSIDNRYKNFYHELDITFDSCFFNMFQEQKNYYYLPTAIHQNFEYSFFKRNYLSLFEKKLINQSKKADILFSGSPRFNRKDNYRQELIKILAKKNIKILICSSKKLWKKSNFQIDTNYEKNIEFSSSGYWATGEMYQSANFVLDLPWLDTIIEELEKNKDPQFALGWNAFRSGYHGSNVITYDCEMNKNVGFNSENCSFYKSNIENINNLAEEIEYIIKNIDKNRIQYIKSNVKKHFNKHTYFERWKFIVDKINLFYQKHNFF